MTLERTTRLLLDALPVAFYLYFVLLGWTLGYPDVLRQPTAQILRRFQAGGAALRQPRSSSWR